LLNTAALIPEPFFEATGAKVSVPMLVEPRSVLAYSKTNAYNAVQLPYTNGRFAALLIEPKSGSVGSFLQTLRPGTLAKIADSVHLGHIVLTMPSLTLSARESLNEPLSDMGLAGLFQSADLSPMLGANGAQQLALVEQAASLRVNDWGTEAAAATGAVFVPFSFGGGASSPSIVFNHPYLFLIRDTTTGAILFSAVVNDPNGA
jgi:serpin B